MELWVRSQDKNYLTPIKDTIKILNDTIFYQGIVLGRYETNKRALEILSEIQKKMNCNFILKPKSGLLSKDDITKEKTEIEKLNNIGIISENSLVSIEPIGDVLHVFEMPEI